MVNRVDTNGRLQQSKLQVEIMSILSGRVIAITGGCGDIGRAVARRLAAEDAAVILLDLLESSLGQDVAGSTGKEGTRVSYHRCDVADRADVDRVFSRIHEEHGRIDVAIANAGIYIEQAFVEIAAEAWAKTLGVNLSGCFHVGQAAAKLMVNQTPDQNGLKGKILFTGSAVQHMTWPEGTAYIVSKAAVKALARNMALELADHGIRVNVMAPGIVMAGMARRLIERDPKSGPRARAAIPIGELSTPERVADAYLFLCSPQSDYMTGSVLLVDGGMSLGKRA